jgi:LysM repeat protein
MNKNHRKSIFRFLTLALVLCGLCTTVQAQSSSVRSQIAELSQRFAELEQKYDLLKLEVSNLRAEKMKLEREVATLKDQAQSPKSDDSVDAKLSRHQRDTEAYIKAQYEKMMTLLTKETGSDTAETAEISTPTPAQPAAQYFPKKGSIYVVKSGDTLSKIASQHGSTVKYIQAANQLDNPNSIFVGQKLFIPVDK